MEKKERKGMCKVLSCTQLCPVKTLSRSYFLLAYLGLLRVRLGLHETEGNKEQVVRVKIS